MTLYAAQSGYEKIRDTSMDVSGQKLLAPDGEPDKQVVDLLNKLKSKFDDAMNNDLNTAVALSVIFDLVRLTNNLLETKNANKGTLETVEKSFKKLGGEVLGIVSEHYGIYHAAKRVIEAEHDALVKIIDNIIEERKAAKEKRDFTTADAIRKKIEESGIVLEDKPGGVTTWRMK
jgi:cysteinyl-tRNA synthetase